MPSLFTILRPPPHLFATGIPFAFFPYFGASWEFKKYDSLFPLPLFPLTYVPIGTFFSPRFFLGPSNVPKPGRPPPYLDSFWPTHNMIRKRLVIPTPIGIPPPPPVLAARLQLDPRCASPFSTAGFLPSFFPICRFLGNECRFPSSPLFWTTNTLPFHGCDYNVPSPF